VVVGFALNRPTAVAAASAENNPFAPTVQQIDARFGRIQQEVDRLRASGQTAAADQMAGQLQHFRNQLAGTAPSQVAGPELDFVGVYDPGKVTVNVGPTGRPTVLVLGSYEPVSWSLNLLPGANLQKVIVSAYDPPAAPANLPAGVPVEFLSPSFLGYNRNLSQTPATARTLTQQTGLPLTSLQGRYSPEEGGSTFTVGDGDAEWTAQRVLTESVPLYKDATAFQTAQDRAAAAPLRFRALDSKRNAALFSPLGPIDGSLTPTPEWATHVAFDPRTSTYYGVGANGVFAFDSRGVASPVAANPFGSSGASGLTFDTTRNRLVLSTINGTGALLSYSPDEKKWSTLASLNNTDPYSLTYSAADDAFYALPSNSVIGTTLVRYDAQGNRVGTIGLSQVIPSFGQLTAAGDQLSLITSAIPDLYEPDLPAMARSYLIDPHTGNVRYLGGISVVPEPGAATLALAALAGLLIRRRAS
jgi:hypothetical protein